MLGPLKDKIWSLQRPAWCPLREVRIDSGFVAVAAFRVIQLKVAINRWLHLHQKEGLCEEENITDSKNVGEMSCN